MILSALLRWEATIYSARLISAAEVAKPLQMTITVGCYTCNGGPHMIYITGRFVHIVGHLYIFLNKVIAIGAQCILNLSENFQSAIMNE